jgi:hypothetical protein
MAGHPRAVGQAPEAPRRQQDVADAAIRLNLMKSLLSGCRVAHNPGQRQHLQEVAGIHNP